MSGAQRSAVYVGTVVHQRLKPRRHRLSYDVFSLLVDLDELPALDRRLRLFSHNRWNLYSLHDRDHGDGSGGDLRGYVDRQLAAAGIDLRGGAVRMLCFPRMFGYVFNPLTVYYCDDADGRPAAMLYEVNNTFGERHSYLIRVDGSDGSDRRHACDKRFYVSPFIAMEGRYRFRLNRPGETLSLVINQSDSAGPLLHASFTARRHDLTDRFLAAAALRFPLLTVKVFAGIHWEALRLWLKGVPLVKRPPPPADAVTLVGEPGAITDGLRKGVG